MSIREIIMVRVSTFTIPEDIYSYTSKERFGKQIPSKYIASGTVEPLKETKKMPEDENDKQVCMSTGGTLKKNR